MEKVDRVMDLYMEYSDRYVSGRDKNRQRKKNCGGRHVVIAEPQNRNVAGSRCCCFCILGSKTGLFGLSLIGQRVWDSIRIIVRRNDTFWTVVRLFIRLTIGGSTSGRPLSE